MKGIFVDTETGGLNPATDALCSVGIVAFDLSLPLAEAVQTQLHFDICVPLDSKLIVTPRALEVQGLTREQLADPARPTEDVVMRRFGGMLLFGGGFRPYNTQVYAWNAPFDAGFLGAALERHRVNCDALDARSMLCARQLAMNLHAAGIVEGPMARGRRLSSLEKWAPLYGLSQPSPHNALTDAILGAKVLWHLARRLGGGGANA